jgi:hypothetical protein
VAAVARQISLFFHVQDDVNAYLLTLKSSHSSFQITMSNQPLYLPLGEAEIIRLVELAPGAHNDPVVVRLFIVELEHAPEYEAISYAWGDPENTMPIFCNGRELGVTVNLIDAFVRVRHPDRPRTLWADAVCINQGSVHERSHQVSFMGRIYQHARTVLICIGQDPDGGAEDVAALVKENVDLILRHRSITEMPRLSQDDPLLDDSRWKSLATLTRRPWFYRAWVLQEAGLAKDPRVLYGDVEFKYRDLMKLTDWINTCAPQLEVRAGVLLYTTHMVWRDWSPDWQKTATYPDWAFLDLLTQARWLECRDIRDHIYAFLGHPLAQLDDGNGTIVTPDYSKAPLEVYLELAAQFLKTSGWRLLSSVEHDDRSVGEDFPSWIPFCWEVDEVNQVICRLGRPTDCDFNASASVERVSPTVIENNYLALRGTIVDVVGTSYRFSDSDFVDPATLKTRQSEPSQRSTMRDIWSSIHEPGAACVYASENLSTAFSLTLLAGSFYTNWTEPFIRELLADFAAYWALWPQSSPPEPEMPTSMPHVDAGKKGDAESFLSMMQIFCTGRTFLITEKGFYGLGPCIVKPGDLCCVLFGANVPHILRKVSGAERYKLVGEAYIHGLMGGEAMGMLEKGGLKEETFVIC